jgi:hypothetical protein
MSLSALRATQRSPSNFRSNSQSLPKSRRSDSVANMRGITIPLSFHVDLEAHAPTSTAMSFHHPSPRPDGSLENSTEGLEAGEALHSEGRRGYGSTEKKRSNAA